MRDALPALSFLIALTFAPFIVTACLVWSILHLTDSGLLVGGGEIRTMASVTDETSKMVACSYVTSAGFVERDVEHKRYGYRGQRNCPWRISLSA